MYSKQLYICIVLYFNNDKLEIILKTKLSKPQQSVVLSGSLIVDSFYVDENGCIECAKIEIVSM